MLEESFELHVNIVFEVMNLWWYFLYSFLSDNWQFENKMEKKFLDCEIYLFSEKYQKKNLPMEDFGHHWSLKVSFFLYINKAQK